MDTEKFLNAFYRTVNRRGPPMEMISNNGSKFIGINREPGELVSTWVKTKIKEPTTYKSIKWYFNLPLAPHFDGVQESIIKAAKTAIIVALWNADRGLLQNYNFVTDGHLILLGAIKIPLCHLASYIWQFLLASTRKSLNWASKFIHCVYFGLLWPKWWPWRKDRIEISFFKFST